MRRRAILQGIGAGTMMSAMSGFTQMSSASGAQGGEGTVFELRIYHANEGKLDGLLARFRDHTMTIFRRHGIESVAYWTPTDDPLKGRTLVYILKHPSRAAATANWARLPRRPGVEAGQHRQRGQWEARREGRIHLHEADGFFAAALAGFQSASLAQPPGPPARFSLQSGQPQPIPRTGDRP